MSGGRRHGSASALLPSLAATAFLSIAAARACAETSAPVYPDLPAPGSYVLHPIQRVPRADLLDAEGQRAELSSIVRGAVTALAFFYGLCMDPAGCPVAWSAFETVQREAENDRLLKSRLRLIFVSLDPAHDTPASMRLLQKAKAATIPWEFFTSHSEEDLASALREMGQEISFGIDKNGGRNRVINHMLKVFLIDPDGWVREIYTTGFLTPENLLNDARTLAMTQEAARNRRSAPPGGGGPGVGGP